MRKSYPRLPNGMGHIKYLGKGRSNPYAVLPPEYGLNYSYKKALCYVPDWYTAFAVLLSYKAGTYHPGDEIDIARKTKTSQEWEMSDYVKKIIIDYQMVNTTHMARHSFKDVYDEFMQTRFGEYATADFSDRTIATYESTVKMWTPIYEKSLDDLTVDVLQKMVNTFADNYSKATIRHALSICSSVFTHAIRKGYIDKSPVPYLQIPVKARNVKHTESYTDDDLKKIKQAAEEGNNVAIFILQGVYSGFRLSAFYDLEIDLENKTLYGGVKTGKRLVPIHPFILPYFKKQPSPPYPADHINRQIEKLCRSLDIPGSHTSHSARHTFKRLCDKYGVNPIASRVLMGHATGKDVHDTTYTHWDLEDLRAEMDKIV